MRAPPDLMRDWQDFQWILDGHVTLTLKDLNELPIRKTKRFQAFKQGIMKAQQEEQQKQERENRLGMRSGGGTRLRRG